MSTTLGWFMHRYAVGIYGNKPNDVDHTVADQHDEATPDAGFSPVDRVETFNGPDTIETYTVVYARDHSPSCGIIVGKTAFGQRFVANSESDQATFDALTNENCIGRAVSVARGPDRCQSSAHHGIIQLVVLIREGCGTVS